MQVIFFVWILFIWFVQYVCFGIVFFLFSLKSIACAMEDILCSLNNFLSFNFSIHFNIPIFDSEKKKSLINVQSTTLN